METARYKSPHTQPFRLTIAGTTLMAIYFLLMRHYYKLMWIKKYFIIDSKGQENLYYYYNQHILGEGGETVDAQMIRALRERRLCNTNLLMEIAVLIVIPMPYYETFVWQYYDSASAKTRY
mmetsp:Transcript_34676/g.53136  ORF Transcript_34676/g.53136 Transcript_34676/m.53136 type:complete len:121 (-) Transcript_34676:1979-2341(-)